MSRNRTSRHSIRISATDRRCCDDKRDGDDLDALPHPFARLAATAVSIWQHGGLVAAAARRRAAFCSVSRCATDKKRRCLSLYKGVLIWGSFFQTTFPILCRVVRPLYYLS